MNLKTKKSIIISALVINIVLLVLCLINIVYGELRLLWIVPSLVYTVAIRSTIKKLEKLKG